MSGTLFVVATPIGNLNDITFRAVETFKKADVIAAEDTRHTKILLKHYHIDTPLISYHQHSNTEKILRVVRSGKTVALATDAGTPGISDPGTALVAGALAEGFCVIPIPGPSAFLTALSACGFPADQFVFVGFAPQKKGRETFFRSLEDAKHTTVFYESPHRIEKCLASLAEYIPNTHVALCRELTKTHEEFLRGTPKEIQEIFQRYPEKKKGEFVVIVNKRSFLLSEKISAASSQKTSKISRSSDN